MMRCLKDMTLHVARGDEVSIQPAIHLTIHQTIQPSIYPSTQPSIPPTTHSSTRLVFLLFIQPSTILSIHLSVGTTPRLVSLFSSFVSSCVSLVFLAGHAADDPASHQAPVRPRSVRRSRSCAQRCGAGTSGFAEDQTGFSSKGRHTERVRRSFHPRSAADTH